MSEYAPGQHPHSRAALKPFMSGDDPRRRPGVESFSRRVLNHLNNLAAVDDDGKATLDLDELDGIASDRAEDHARATAARILGHVRSEGWDKIERHPRLLSTLSWLFDRQLGKPPVTVNVDVQTANVPGTLAELTALVQSDPQALALLDMIVQDARRPRLEPVEGEAVALAAAVPAEVGDSVADGSCGHL